MYSKINLLFIENNLCIVEQYVITIAFVMLNDVMLNDVMLNDVISRI
jgi:hypothetical protein